VDQDEPLVALEEPVAAALEPLDRGRSVVGCVCRCRCRWRAGIAVASVSVSVSTSVPASASGHRVGVVAVERVLPCHLELLVRLPHGLPVGLRPPAVPVPAEVARRTPVEEEQAARRRRSGRRARDREVVGAVVPQQVDDVLVAEPGAAGAGQDVAQGLGRVAGRVEALGGAGHFGGLGV